MVSMVLLSAFNKGEQTGLREGRAVAVEWRIREKCDRLRVVRSKPRNLLARDVQAGACGR
jgi:hypothetical protein